MFILIEHKRTWEKREYNWVKEYYSAVSPGPKQNEGTITTWWSGTQSSRSEKLKQTDLFFLACPMQAGNVNSLLNSLNNGIKKPLLHSDYISTIFGKCSFFWKGVHRWEGGMSNGASKRFSQLLVSQHPSQACRTHWLRVSFGLANKGRVRTLTPECHRPNPVH